MNLEPRTHIERDYAGCVEKLCIIDDALERKVGRKASLSNHNVIIVQSQGTQPTKICGTKVDKKGITSMKISKGMSREKRTTFLEEGCKLIYKGISPNSKQGGSGNGTRQLINMNKDDHEAIIIEVVTAIGKSASNADNTKTSKVYQATTFFEEQSPSDPNKGDIEKTEENMSVNELITTCAVHYLNAHLKVTRKLVYDYYIFPILSTSAQS